MYISLNHQAYTIGTLVLLYFTIGLWFLVTKFKNDKIKKKLKKNINPKKTSKFFYMLAILIGTVWLFVHGNVCGIYGAPFCDATTCYNDQWIFLQQRLVVIVYIILGIDIFGNCVY